MQTIRIILSANKSLQQERMELADLVENLNHSLESRNANILMLVWDGSVPDQNSFKEKISETDLFLTLYYDTFDESTQSELETAYQSLCEGKNPKKIYVYFKEGETVPEQLKTFRDSFPTKYGHFYCSFSNIDTLKADFLLQFMEYQSKNLGSNKMLEVSNGKVTIDGKEYVDLKNVPFAGNNEEYNLLLKSIKKTQKLLAITEEDDPDYADYAADLQNMKEKLSKMESSLWDTALMITRLSTTKCSERLKRAMDLFTAGDNKGAQAVLNEEEIEKDIQHNLNLIKLGEEGKKGLKTNLEEYHLMIQTYENEMEDGWEGKVIPLFEKYIKVGYGIVDDIVYDEMILHYYDLLLSQEQYDKALKYSNEILNNFEKLFGENHPRVIKRYQELGDIYWELNEFEKAAETLIIVLNRKKKTLGIHNPSLMALYNSIGRAFHKAHNVEQAKIYFDYGLSLMKDEHNKFGPYIPLCEGYGNLLKENGEYVKAIELYSIAAKAYEPHNIFNSFRLYNKIAKINYEIGDYENAICYGEMAITILLQNSYLCNKYLASTLNNIKKAKDKIKQKTI